MINLSHQQYQGNVAIIGAQWGDEGKGKLSDILSQENDIVCRSIGGANAGHTIVVGDKRYVFHLLPSCLLHEHTTAFIGNGVVLHLQTLIKEINDLGTHGLNIKDRVKIDRNAHILLDYHKKIDEVNEERKGNKSIGTTKRGIGPAYTDKIARIGIRCEDLFDSEILCEKIRENVAYHNARMGLSIDAEKEIDSVMSIKDEVKTLLVDGTTFILDAIKNKKKVMFEGAQAHHLDIDHGTYPYVTSTSTSIGGIFTGLGVPPKHIDTVIGVVKSYTTRVGDGPFPTEIVAGEMGNYIRKKGHEFGATTGRPRRVGWFDSVMVRRAVAINGMDELNFTKLDILDEVDEIQVATKYMLHGQELHTIPTTPKALSDMEIVYESVPGWKSDTSSCASFEELPLNAQNYIRFIEELCETKITSIGVGMDRTNLIWKK